MSKRAKAAQTETSSSKAGASSSTGVTAKPDRSKLIFGGIVAFVVVAGVVAVLASGGTSKGGTSTQPVVITGAPLTRFDESVPDASSGKPVPKIAGKDFTGTPVAVPTAGKRTLIVIVAHWCPHCQREVPRLVAWEKSGGVPGDLDVVILSTGVAKENGNYPPSDWLKREKNPFPVIADDATTSAGIALGQQNFPTMVLVDAKGRLIARTSGEKTSEELAAFVSLGR